MIILSLVAVVTASLFEYTLLRVVLRQRTGWGLGFVVYLLPHAVVLLLVLLLSAFAVDGEWVWLGETMAVDRETEIAGQLAVLFLLSAPFFVGYGVGGLVILAVMISRRRGVLPLSS